MIWHWEVTGADGKVVAAGMEKCTIKQDTEQKKDADGNELHNKPPARDS